MLQSTMKQKPLQAFFNLSIYLSIYPRLYLSIYLPRICLYLFIHLPVESDHISIYSSSPLICIYISIYSSLLISIYLSIYHIYTDKCIHIHSIAHKEWQPKQYLYKKLVFSKPKILKFYHFLCNIIQWKWILSNIIYYQTL